MHQSDDLNTLYSQQLCKVLEEASTKKISRNPERKGGLRSKRKVLSPMTCIVYSKMVYIAKQDSINALIKALGQSNQRSEHNLFFSSPSNYTETKVGLEYLNWLKLKK